MSTASSAEENIPTFFVRALYDYQSTDASSLTFHKDDLIEVLTQLPTGWWDGLLDDERGWFPSNYVTPVSDQEADEELALRAGRHPDSDAGPIQVEQVSDGWLEDTADLMHASPSPDVGHDQVAVDDFWMPEVTADGQIFYVNSRTGEQSQDIPSEVDSAPEPDEPLRNERASGPARGAAPDRQNGVTNRNGADPWVRRIADDGLSHYWHNTITGEAQWSPPSQAQQQQSQQPHRIEPIQPPEIQDDSDNDPDLNGRIQPPYSMGDRYKANMDDPSSRRVSVYSDDSDIVVEHDLPSRSISRAVVLTSTPVSTVMDLAEENAQALQSQMAPRPPETLVSYSESAREVINDVIESTTSISNAPHDTQIDFTEHASAVTSRVSQVVFAVRNLLYVSGMLAPPPSSLLPQTSMDETVESARSPMVELKPYQRKVTATLSKLVLSARAANSNPDWTSLDGGARVDQDAAELDRAVVTLVAEVQRASSFSRIKRLQGALESVNGRGGIGAGLCGGGVAGHTKGLGFVPLDGDGHEALVKNPRQSEFLVELKGLSDAVEDQLRLLETIVQERDDQAATRVIEAGQHAVTDLSTLLAFIEDTDIASYVSIEPPTTSPNSNAALAFTETVLRARTVIRALEASKQAVFDEGMILLMVCEGAHVFTFVGTGQDAESEPRETWGTLKTVITSLRAQMDGATKCLEELVAISKTQGNNTAQNRGLYGRDPYRQSHSTGYEDVTTPGFTMSSRTRASTRASSPPPTLGDQDHPSIEGDFVDMEQALRNAELPDGFDASAMFFDEPSSSRRSRAMPPPTSSSQLRDVPRTAPREYVKPMPSSGRMDGVSSPSRFQSHSGAASPALVIQNGGRSRPLSPDLDDDGDILTTSKSPSRPAKIKQLLGDDAPEVYIQQQQANSQPWYLQPSYGPKEILINPDGGIRGGTLSALVERLTMHNYRDATFHDTFMMTFKSFATVAEIFDELVARFNILPPEGLNEQEYAEWVKVKQEPIRMRVLNAFKSMLQEDDVIGEEDMVILGKIRAFSMNITEKYLGPAVKRLVAVVEQVQSNGGESVSRKVVVNAPTSAPQPILPKSVMRKMKLLDLDPRELARQLTLKESELFCKIRAFECLARAKEQGDNDNIRTIISMSNKIADWVNDVILSKDDPRKRSLIIKQFILVAEHCRSLHNFSTMAALIAALNTPPIRRLRRTWEQVNPRLINVLDDLEKTLDSGKNFTGYRNLLASVSLPCVPFIGVYLTTLTFIQDGIKDTLVKEGNLINFSKRQKAAEIIREIKRYQSKPYNLLPVESIRLFLDESLSLEKTSDYFWELSITREVREKEEDRMARLLQESGFL